MCFFIGTIALLLDIEVTATTCLTCGYKLPTVSKNGIAIESSNDCNKLKFVIFCFLNKNESVENLLRKKVFEDTVVKHITT